MSAGAFQNSFYESDSGEIYNVRIQPETLAGSSNPAPAGPATAEPSAIVNGSRRRIGVNCRNIRLKWTGTPPAGYDTNGVIKIPILQQATWAGFTKGDEISYLGTNAEVIGKTPEYIN